MQRPRAPVPLYLRLMMLMYKRTGRAEKRSETEEREFKCMAYRYRWRTRQTQQPPALRRAPALCTCNLWDMAYMAMVDICTHGCHRGNYTYTWHSAELG
ncbi:hypothetical protein NDU88_001772 [Pleurodeles waltl]|uniref:Secreted protein n=1 Tax=Pleurodeles waltl TaxID=8319 RepID=A0AAV7NF89_PLEWA|nr:hypothetical protein NDU88_001772 [Pleurodeles waltl]